MGEKEINLIDSKLGQTMANPLLMQFKKETSFYPQTRAPLYLADCLVQCRYMTDRKSPCQ